MKNILKLLPIILVLCMVGCATDNPVAKKEQVYDTIPDGRYEGSLKNIHWIGEDSCFFSWKSTFIFQKGNLKIFIIDSTQIDSVTGNYKFMRDSIHFTNLKASYELRNEDISFLSTYSQKLSISGDKAIRLYNVINAKKYDIFVKCKNIKPTIIKATQYYEFKIY